MSQRAARLMRVLAACALLLSALASPRAASAQIEPEPAPVLPPGKQLPPIPVTPSREPGAPKAKNPGEVEDDQPRCEQAFIEHVYKATKPSVVRITRPDGGLGTGFVFFSNKHVATALHVVDLGRDVRV